jgi:hypothetical protein
MQVKPGSAPDTGRLQHEDSQLSGFSSVSQFLHRFFRKIILQSVVGARGGAVVEAMSFEP